MTHRPWPNLAAYGAQLRIALFREPEGARAAVLSCRNALSPVQAARLTGMGFVRIVRDKEVYARPGDAVDLNRLRQIFPSALAMRTADEVIFFHAERSPFTAAAPAPERGPEPPRPAGPSPSQVRPVGPRPPQTAPATIQSRPPAALVAPFRTAPPDTAPATPRSIPPRPPAVAPPTSRPQAAGTVGADRAPATPAPPAAAQPGPGPRPVTAMPRFDKPGSADASVTVATTLRPALALADEAESLADAALADPDRPNRFQAKYRPASRVGTPIAMIPANLAAPTAKALARVVDEVGDIDAFTADRLGWSVARMAEVLSPEQVDAVALALHAADRKRGLIVADQTGLGKGRVMAAIIRASILSGRRVVFFTEKENLFSDIWRDLRDIGSDELVGRPFILNTGSRIVDTASPDSEVLHTALKASELKKVIAAGVPPEGYSLFLATYSQLNRPGPKVDFLAACVEEGHAIVDECHNAAGDSATSAGVGRILGTSRSSTYSSATFARGAENLATYRPVLPPSLRDADLVHLYKAGGHAFAEALSQALAEEGVLIRREHDLSNIRIEVRDDLARIDRNRSYADALSPILADLARLSRIVDALADQQNERNEDVVAQAGTAAERKAVKEKWYTINFGACLSGIMRQFQTALEVDFCVETCVEALRNDVKPVVVIETTMEALMRQLAEAAEAADPDASEAEEPVTDGDDGPAEEGERAPDFRDALRLMVDRMSHLIVKRDKADPERVPAEHDDVQALRTSLLDRIEGFPELPFSPIDEVRNRVEAAGRYLHEQGEIPAPWVMDEISARGMKVERGSYVPMPPRDRNTVIAGFNGGRIDGLVVTRAGSTGLSLHASEKVADRRQRLMIEHQIPANVVERVQFWGRVNRRGQVNEPGFATLSTGLPMQARPLAMQNKKVADLSANVSGSADNATSMDVPDILDTIGNEIARALLEERPSLAERMCIAMKVDPEAADAELYFVNKILQRLVLLSSEEQDALFAEMLDLYGDRVREMEAVGRHPHGSRELDGKWRVVERETFAGADDRDGDVFGRPVFLTTIETLRQTKPLRRTDVAEAVYEANRRLEAHARASRIYGLFEDDVLHLKAMRESLLADALPRRFASVEQALNASGPNSVKIADARGRRFREILAYVRPGLSLSAPDEDGRQMTGVVVDVRRPSADEMHLPGRWMVRYVLPGDEKPREISIATLVREQNYNLNEPMKGRPLDFGWPNFDAIPGGRVKMERKVLDGNLVAAVRMAAESAEGTFGSAVAYVGEDGTRRKGVLIPKSKQSRLQNLPGFTSLPEVALAVLRTGGRLDSTAGSDKSLAASMMLEGRSLVVQLPWGRNRKAAKPYLASGEFEQAVEGVAPRDESNYREYRIPLDLAGPCLSAVLAVAGRMHFAGRYRKVALDAAANDAVPAPERRPMAAMA